MSPGSAPRTAIGRVRMWGRGRVRSPDQLLARRETLTEKIGQAEPGATRMARESMKPVIIEVSAGAAPGDWLSLVMAARLYSPRRDGQ